MSTRILLREEVLDLLATPREVAICGHVNPDGDSLGSALALTALLRAKGHTVTNLLAKGNKAPELYDFFEDYTFTPAADYNRKPDLFIAIDVPNKDRLGEAAVHFDRATETLVIDHHPDYTGFATHYYGDPSVSATGALVWRLIMASEVTPTKAMATYCYVALITDTGRFSFQNTTAEAFKAAGEMVSFGLDPSAITRLVYDSRLLASLQLDARLISRIAYAAEGRVVYSWVTESDFVELNVSRDETEGLPTILRSVKGTDVAVLLREEDGRVRVNLRAKGCCDVGAFARRFGGGGHQAAAGFTLEATLEEVKALIVKEARTCVALQADNPSA
ncbi:MAG: DHH family phosphoesterase [Coriobacteriia bacterium]|nr:DHH family phosphoesterase [Coriobacteriia bacterium]